MNSIKYKGLSVHMSDKDYKQMLKRFDHKQFRVLEGRSAYRNDTPCPMCMKYTPGCRGCTFHKLENRGSPGCMRILNDISDYPHNRRFINLDGRGVGFLAANRTKAVEQLNLAVSWLEQAK